MPELPEVETVRAGLAPFVEGAHIDHVALHRPDLRFPFPAKFAERLAGRTIGRAARRAKYLLFELDDGQTLLSHLGMTGSYRFIETAIAEPTRYRPPQTRGKHDHIAFTLTHPLHGLLHLIYADPRRFGFFDLFGDKGQSAFLLGLGPEPLGNDFNAHVLAARFAEKKAPVKAALLDQSIVAGLGNIYVCEALHRAHILPDVPCAALVASTGEPSRRLHDLAIAIATVLIEAIDAGGSTLRDFRKADGTSGYFQHRFAVYDREGEPCPMPLCTGTVRRMVQSGRSSFFCPVCQHGP